MRLLLELQFRWAIRSFEDEATKTSRYYGDSLVVVDTSMGIGYPLPFDYYSGRTTLKTRVVKKSELTFSWEATRYASMGQFSCIAQPLTENSVSTSMAKKSSNINQNICDKRVSERTFIANHCVPPKSLFLKDSPNNDVKVVRGIDCRAITFCLEP